MKNFKQQLRQGDIIMYHAHSWISRTIRRLDATDYNHCAIYDKNGFVYEAVGSGVQYKTLENSLTDQKTEVISIFRVKNIEPHDFEQVINTLKKFPRKNFAHTQIILIAALLWKKSLKYGYFTKNFIRYFLRFFNTFITKFWDSSNQNMVCSELIYRAFLETAKVQHNDNLAIHIPVECSSIMLLTSHTTQRLYPCRMPEDNCLGVEKTETIDTKKDRITQLKNIITGVFDADTYLLYSLTKYHQTYSEKRAYLEKKTAKIAEILKQYEFYNFITPGDIARSWDTTYITTYRSTKSLKYKRCITCNPK